jgi:GNAT superfamily N-acetyltransferase
VWSSLAGAHRALAAHLDDLTWYSPSVAPFAAIPNGDVVPDLEAAHARGLGNDAYFVGACPKSLPAGWRFTSHSHILQLFPAGDFPEMGEEWGSVLGHADRSAMRELTQIAFPDFFRDRTADLGLYMGVYEGAKLIAMAGERLAVSGLQEISGVCTHPDFAGRGNARRLTRSLLSRHRRRGVRSFLHVSEGNAAARRLYDSMGFVARASLPMCRVERTAE